MNTQKELKENVIKLSSKKTVAEMTNDLFKRLKEESSLIWDKDLIDFLKGGVFRFRLFSFYLKEIFKEIKYSNFFIFR